MRKLKPYTSNPNPKPKTQIQKVRGRRMASGMVLGMSLEATMTETWTFPARLEKPETPNQVIAIKVPFNRASQKTQLGTTKTSRQEGPPLRDRPPPPTCSFLQLIHLRPVEARGRVQPTAPGVCKPMRGHRRVSEGCDECRRSC